MRENGVDYSDDDYYPGSDEAGSGEGEGEGKVQSSGNDYGDNEEDSGEEEETVSEEEDVEESSSEGVFFSKEKENRK